MRAARHIPYEKTPAGFVVGVGPQAITIINQSARAYTKSRFVLWFGAYGWTRLMVYANHLQDALDECIDWLVEHAPGHICDEQVTEAYREAIAEGKSENEAYETAEQDTISGGNAGNHILSYEWGIICENPTRAELREMIAQ